MKTIDRGINGCMAFTALPIVSLLAFQAPAHAGPVIKIDDTKWLSVEAGLRTSFSSVEEGAPNGNDRSADFAVDSIQLYLNGQIHQDIKFTFNTARNDSTDAVRVLDAIARFEFSDTFNVWAGRFLPPSDRSNLSGPYHLNIWAFPFVQNYPAFFAGRDNGAAVWGQTGGGQFKYQVGVFNGREGGSNVSDSLLYAGRLTYNFWDPEPGYYNSSAYFGAKDILAVGAVAMQQKDGAGDATTKDDFKGWSLDTLVEKKLANDGVVSLEGAYYNYDLNKVTDVSLVDGKSYFVLAGYLFPQKVGIGKLQPHVRYQSFDPTGPSNTHNRTEAGLNYIIDGHNARASLTYANDDSGTPGSSKIDSIVIGIQLKI